MEIRDIKTKRSRNGCLSCKRLRIKCDEGKPKCEYCLHTGRDCNYPGPRIFAPIVTNPANATRRKYTKRVRNSEYDDEVEDDYDEDDELSLMMTNAMITKRYDSYDLEYRTLKDELSLNQITTQLSISKFELRLLSFFNNHCIHLFSFGRNPEIHDVWSKKVPQLFLGSELIRNSIYSFASVNLFKLCDLENLRIQDELDSDIKSASQLSFSEMPFNKKSSAQLQQNLYLKTTNYFMESISKKNRLLSHYYGPFIVDVDAAKELLVSSLLIFSFLGIHPHRLLPLISFRADEADFLSICKGIRQTIISCAPVIRQTSFNGLFSYEKVKWRQSPYASSSTYPVIINFKRDLDSEYFNNQSSNEYTSVMEALDVLQDCIYKVQKFKYHVPMYIWILSLPHSYHDLLYTKNFQALRLLYIFSSLCIMARFQLFDESSLWLDFMFWYRRYNFELFDNQWKYEMDDNLFQLAFVKCYRFSNVHMTNGVTILDFDPNLIAAVI